MKQTIDAVFEDGVFNPLSRLEIPHGQKVRLEVEAPEILHLMTSLIWQRAYMKA